MEASQRDNRRGQRREMHGGIRRELTWPSPSYPGSVSIVLLHLITDSLLLHEEGTQLLPLRP